MNVDEVLPKEVSTFINAAIQFVDFCEQMQQDEPNKLVSKSSLLLSELYTSALKLPQVRFRDAPYPPEGDRNFSQRLTKNLEGLPFQIYFECLEPTNIDKQGDVAAADLYDDIADIYHDLKAGLWLADNGHWEAAVWHWRLLYWHWSDHVMGALYALHRYQTSQGAGWFPELSE